MATLEDLHRMEEYLGREMPDLKIAFKDQSWLHLLIGVVLFPFNPNYLTTYATTLGSTVYFPSKDSYEKDPTSSMVTLAHELVHVYDAKHSPFFRLAYLFPQVLVVIPLVLSLACSSWFLLGLLVAAPWPAKWRVSYELRGYGMNLAFWTWRKARIPPEYTEEIAQYFVGLDYFHMSWNKAYVRRSLEATRQQAEQGALSTIKPYSIVHDFLKYNGMIPRNDE